MIIKTLEKLSYQSIRTNSKKNISNRRRRLSWVSFHRLIEYGAKVTGYNVYKGSMNINSIYGN